MNIQKFTQKSLEAIQLAQDAALQRGNMQISQEHLCYALLTQEGGLIPQLLTRMGADPGALERQLIQEMDKIPGVSGPGRESGKIYVSPEVDKMLINAEQQAAHMKDDYVSVEHVMLAVLEGATGALRRLLQP